MVNKSLEIIEEITFDKSTYQFSKEGIVIVHVHDHAFVDLPDIMSEHQYLKQKSNYLPLRLLVNPGKATSISNEVREFINLPESMELVNCQAILVDNLAHKILASFMMKLYKQPNKFKIFSDKSQAIEWLRKQ